MKRSLFITIFLYSAMAFGQQCVPSNTQSCTPNVQLALPFLNAPNWNVPLIQNFTLLDTLLKGFGSTGNALTAYSLDNIAYVDGQHYAQTGVGLAQAISDSIANGSREVHVCGTIPISTTINITTGGVSIIGCGSGGINNALVPTAMLQWTGAAGSDLLQITGQANPRMDKVKLQNLILDGGGAARYDLRMEKVDIVSLYDVRFRNAATAGLYAVDATGIEGINVNCGTIASYCMVLDWGTGGSIFTGIQVENDVSSTLPLVLLQGASRGFTFNGFQCDGTNTSFGGCIQITGFDSNSSFPGAPTGGAGAPQSVKITNPDVTIHAAATTPSQGADILITGTATNQSSHISIEGLNDLGGTVSASAVKIDQANNVEIRDGISSSHTAASLNITANAAKVRRLYFQSLSDTASCTGTGCASMSTVDQNSNGSLTFGPNQLVQELASVDFAAQSTAIATATLYAVPSTGAGQYRVSWDAKVTTAAGTSSTLGALTITYTDPDGVVQTITAAAQTSAGVIGTTSTGNTTTTALLGLPMLLNCKASTNIQYAFAYASVAANAMAYNLHLKLEQP